MFMRALDRMRPHTLAIDSPDHPIGLPVNLAASPTSSGNDATRSDHDCAAILSNSYRVDRIRLLSDALADSTHNLKKRPRRQVLQTIFWTSQRSPAHDVTISQNYDTPMRAQKSLQTLLKKPGHQTTGLSAPSTLIATPDT